MIPYIINASNYYIDQNHPSASDQNPGTIDQPWKTLTKANQTLVGGDTVFIKTGTYNTYVAPVNSGTSTSPIVYRNYGNDKVTVSDTWYGINLDGKSYIVVDGIRFYNLYYFMYLRNNANNNVIANCSFDQAKLTDGKTYSWAGSRIFNTSSYNRIHHCQFSKYGYYTDDDIGSVLDIGNENNTTDMTSHNLIEDCVFFHGGHHILGVYSMNNIIRNNYFHNEPWSMGTAQSDRGAILYGDRNISVSGYAENSGRNLFEGNQIAYSSDPPDNVGASGMSLTTSNNIVRFNRFYHNDRAGLSMSVTSSYCQNIINNKIYHNTFFHNGINTQDPTDHMNSGIGFGFYSGSLLIQNNYIINNLLYNHRVPYGTYKVNLDDQVFAGNWVGESQGDPKFVSASPVLGDPFNRTLPDLGIKPDSPCKDKGTYLTKISSASGTGKSFYVEDAGYFMDGWGIKGVQGDEIQIFQTSQKARIVSVDYSSKLITVDKEITWTQNQGICFPYKDNGPDPGAYETLDPQVGIGSVTVPEEIIIYPNPTTGLLTVSLKEPFDSDYLVEIYNTHGHLLQSISKNPFEQEFSIDLGIYPQGIYILRFYSRNKVYHYKIIRN